MYANAQIEEDPGWFKTLFIDTTMIKNLAGTPAKKNMKTQNQVRSKSERCKLRKRYRIENMFGRIDKFKRLYTRRDRTICMFEAGNFKRTGQDRATPTKWRNE
jgi:hypothetical protein